MSFLYKGKEIPVGGGSGGGEGSSEEVYSTEETRIGTWIDGRPLYRVVAENTVSGSVDVWNEIAVIPDIDQMIFADGYIFTADKSGIIAVPNRSTILKLEYPNKIRFITNSSNQVGTKISIAITYTKKTDIAAVSAGEG